MVVLHQNGQDTAHYVDSFGFTQVPEFFIQREKQLTPDALLTGENIQTPRGSFLVTDMSREQMEAAGYAFGYRRIAWTVYELSCYRPLCGRAA